MLDVARQSANDDDEIRDVTGQLSRGGGVPRDGARRGAEVVHVHPRVGDGVHVEQAAAVRRDAWAHLRLRQVLPTAGGGRAQDAQRIVRGRYTLPCRPALTCGLLLPLLELKSDFQHASSNLDIEKSLKTIVEFPAETLATVAQLNYVTLFSRHDRNLFYLFASP